MSTVMAGLTSVSLTRNTASTGRTVIVPGSVLVAPAIARGLRTCHELHRHFRTVGHEIA